MSRAEPHGAGGTVTFARTGKSVTVDAATSVLEAGEGVGELMPFGCRMGICQSCVVELVDGHVRDLRTGEITRVLRDGYDVSLLHEGLQALIRELSLDTLLVDTHPGLNEETLLSIAVSDVLVIIMRPDQQDYQGTGVTVEVARSLEVPRIMLVVNKTPSSFDHEDVEQRVAATYACEVAAVIPHSDDLMALASAGIMLTRFPRSDLAALYRKLGDRLLRS